MSETSSHWCILRTAGPKTLKLVEALNAAGIEAWTPARTVRRQKPGRSTRADGKRPTVDVAVPILPTFVFARARHKAQLRWLSSLRFKAAPDFSIMMHAGRVPEIADRDVAGLRDAEERAEAQARAQREAETREEADRIRIAMIRSESERLRAMRVAEKERVRAMRAQRRDDLGPGTAVRVDSPAFAGMSGVVESSDGRTAWIKFGGSIAFKVEAWQVLTDTVQAA